MRIVMLGWEYPPHISGGLGTACQGLTTALAHHGIELDFVVPHLFGDEDAEHMHLVGAHNGGGRARAVFRPPRRSRRRGVPPEAAAGAPQTAAAASEGGAATTDQEVPEIRDPTTGTVIRLESVPALLKPYLSEHEYEELYETHAVAEHNGPSPAVAPDSATHETSPGTAATKTDERKGGAAPPPASNARPHYGRDLFEEVARFAGAAAHRVRRGNYDLVHAHDWMTFPAGLRIAQELGIPLLTHVHSLEYDRAGTGGNPNIEAIERIGIDGSERVIAVSYYTRGLINRIHHTPLEKIEVVHNGVYARNTVRAYQRERRTTGPVVLFLGRITFQKGPEYFVHAAAKVLEHIPDCKFVMAGSGDMLPRMKALADELGIADAFRFPGFVKGADLERTFSTADVYVMPSVSEPFGIAPLEAMSYDRPVIVSKQSGVSEVLRNALKVDFWDTDKIASQIVGLLEFEELRDLIIARAREEIRNIHWDAAAQKLIPVYKQLLMH